MKTLVIGIGNIIRRDDGLGPWVLQKLMDKKEAGNFSLEILHQLDITLCPRMAAFDRVVIIDAQQGVFDEPVAIVEVEPKEEAPSFSTHIGSLANLLFLTEKIFEKRPRGYLAAIRGEDFGAGEGLSEVARANGELAVEKIWEFLYLKN